MDALASYRQVVVQWPKGEMVDDALFELGLTFYGLRRWDEANGSFSQLLSDHQDSPLADDALGHYGNTFIALADFDNALEAFEEAISRDTMSPEIRNDIIFQKAWLLYRNERYAEAAPAFQQLYTRPEFASRADEALFWAAESHFQSGRLSDAEKLF